jgi:hypothetical protein
MGEKQEREGEKHLRGVLHARQQDEAVVARPASAQVALALGIP